MDAKTRLDKLIKGALGMMSYFKEEITEAARRRVAKESESSHSGNGGDAPEMIRVADSTGDEYLCPAGALHDKNFVGEQEKKACFDYEAISQHYLE